MGNVDNGPVVQQASFLYRFMKVNVCSEDERTKPVDDSDPNENKENKEDSIVNCDTDGYLSCRSKSLQEAKQAFLISTITTDTIVDTESETTFGKNPDCIRSEDSRSTGGGTVLKEPDKLVNTTKFIDQLSPKKSSENYPRKVSFKIKNTNIAHKKQQSHKKEVVTIKSSKVADLTKKYNEMIDNKDHKLTEADLIKSVERLQKNGLATGSSCSTLSPNDSITLVVKNKIKRKNSNIKKKSSSSESLDKINELETPIPKRKLDRSKSDGLKRRPSKRRYDLNKTIESRSETKKGDERRNLESSKITTVKDAVKKFESQSNGNTISNKPEIPQKKLHLTVTKNIVIKDGKPKIKNSRLDKSELFIQESSNITQIACETKKKPISYEKSKYKPYVKNKEKVTYTAVEIIPEEIDVNIPTNSFNLDIEQQYQYLKARLSPNQSFLWGKLINDQPPGASDKLVESFSKDTRAETKTALSEFNIERDPNSNDQNIIEAINDKVIIEARNNEVIKSIEHPNIDKVTSSEDGYEILEPIDAKEIRYTVQKTCDRPLSKINCPLPEIPKEEVNFSVSSLYRSLKADRSHPEGEESCSHGYETCDLNTERTRGDGESDDGYYYFKTPEQDKELKTSDFKSSLEGKGNYSVSKSASSASTVSYEKIDSDSTLYEKIPPRPRKKYPYRTSVSDNSCYNEGENIYDTIKHHDAVSLSNCYESIPNSPGSVAKFRSVKTPVPKLKRLSLDAMSDLSHSTMSSEQKTNSIYGQRSVISFSGQEVVFPVANSESSFSGNSDRSDDWVDISEPEEDPASNQIIIVREKSRATSNWSQKVRHQWQKSPKKNKDASDCDSSDSGHYYESLNISNGEIQLPKRPVTPIEEDFDSFDSDSDTEPSTQHKKNDSGIDLENSKLPEPPAAGHNIYTLTKFASAASKKMRELTKRYSVSIKNTKTSRRQSDQQKEEKPKIQPIYANCSNSDSNKSIYGHNQNRLSGKFDDEQTDATPNEKTSGGTLSRKTYFSFKTRFRRSTSMAVDLNSDVPGPLKITNSTFYLTDSIDGDSGFSNCSDSVQLNGSGSSETLSQMQQQQAQPRKRSVETGTKYESSPNLALPSAASKRLSYCGDKMGHYLSIQRPLAPPPPPPTDLAAVNEELKRLLPSLSRREKKNSNRTSWYAECTLEPTDSLKRNHKIRPSSSNWYTDMGLYWTGSACSSSGASSASPTPNHHPFIEEPLYQFYNAAKVESVCRENTDSDSEGYEAITEIRRDMSSRNSSYSHRSEDRSTPTVPPPPLPPFANTPTTTTTRSAPNRTLWCQLPEVQGSPVLSSLSTSQKRVQEAKFEILTSEASYLNSLLVLENHFINHPAFRDENTLNRTDWDILFGTIIPVRKCSQHFMYELEKCWKGNILLHGLCDVIMMEARRHFDVYIKYCENQIFLVKTLQRLKAKPGFIELLTQLESHPACQCLSLHSFLMLPMQRITRMPLLVDAVLRNLDSNDEEYQSCRDTLATLNSLVSECNEGARNMERVEEMYRLAASIEFPPHIASAAPNLAPVCRRKEYVPNVDRNGRRGAPPPDRHLVRSGALTQITWRDDLGKLTFGRKVQKVPLYLFLFTDVLVITKKKGEDSFMTIDFCQRSLIEVSSGDFSVKLNLKESPGKHLMLLTLLENSESKTVEMILSCSSESDCSRWIEALSPAQNTEGECVYGGWDCPQVAAIYSYTPAQPDELQLNEGDIVNVSRKMNDGWYFGERIRDGETGWFPGNYTLEVASQHVRAKNLRQRYRLLGLSGSYLGQKKKT